VKNFFKKLAKGERGAVNIASTLLIGISMIFLAVGFIMFPLITAATDDLLDYSYTGSTSNFTDASFTGFTSVVGITPLLVLLGFLSASIFAMWMGVRVSKGAAGGTKLDMGTIVMLGLSMVFIAIGLIIMPVTLDSISGVLDGVSASYTGLESILLVTPLLVLIGFLGAAVLSGFFGIKRLGSGGPAD